jgi:DNA-binding NarL/FixJ family response regulator
MMQQPIRIVLIEDDDVIRRGYQVLISEAPDCRVVRAYASVEEALRTIRDDGPDVILLDIELPGTNGIESIPKLKRLVPRVHVIMLTVYDSEKQVFDALGNGASGYLTKDTPTEKIAASIREVMRGGGPMSSNIARMVIDSFRKNQDTPLSKRETQVLELIGSGKSRSQIANELFIDLETVRSHIKNIYLKLDVNSRADALKAARENRFI